MVVFTITNFEALITTSQQVTSQLKQTLAFNRTSYLAPTLSLVLGV